VGQPVDDLDRLRRTLELLRQEKLYARRVRVGAIEIDGLVLLSPPAAEGTVDGDGLTDLSPEEREALRKQHEEADEEIMYAASRAS
jgi:hypothetical protein